MYELVDQFCKERDIPVDFVESSGMMKTVTRIAGLDIQTKTLSKAVRAAQMRMTRAAAFICANENGIVMRCVLIE